MLISPPNQNLDRSSGLTHLGSLWKQPRRSTCQVLTWAWASLRSSLVRSSLTMARRVLRVKCSCLLPDKSLGFKSFRYPEKGWRGMAACRRVQDPFAPTFSLWKGFEVDFRPHHFAFVFSHWWLWIVLLVSVEADVVVKRSRAASCCVCVCMGVCKCVHMCVL